MRTTRLFLLLVTLVSTGLAADKYRLPIDTVNQTLNYINIDTSDIGFRTDWVDLDSFRLEIIDKFMRRPLGIPSYLKATGDSFLDSNRSVRSKHAQLMNQLISPDSVSWKDWLSITDYASSVYKYFDTFEKTRRDCDSLAYYVKWTTLQMDFSLTYGLLHQYSPEERRFFIDTFTVFLQEEEKDVNRPLEELDKIQQFHDSLAVRLKQITDIRSPRTLIAIDAGPLIGYEDLVNWLERNPDLVDKLAHCDLLSKFNDVQTPLGRIAVRGTASDRYEGFYDLIIDLGGDDEYFLSRSEDFHNQIIIDLSGNDRYIALSDHTMGAGFFSTGILDDWSGNDTYLAGSYSQGCGLFGTGILIDRAGDDLYRGDIGCQAASSFGIGMLLDYAGRDTYDAALYSQGFGFIMGASALVDRGGNDKYTAGWKYGDILRYEDHYVSLSQGFGYGLRPYFSGGVGLLIDGGGNDQYASDIFGQGASYWFALGGLVDYGGNDNYIAYQYAQGAATHMCAAALVDIEGDDLYSSKGVSQGCGHDIAFGLLLDCDGNDQYSATDLSQAAGSANGIGILIDLFGDDGHIARVQTNTHGYGNPRREFGSVGLFLDLGGTDSYRGFGTDDSYWVTPSKWGIGADLNSEKKK